jgi:hypothetical protein
MWRWGGRWRHQEIGRWNRRLPAYSIQFFLSTAKELLSPTPSFIAVHGIGLLDPNHNPIDRTDAHFETSVALLFETGGYLSLFGMIGWKLDVKFLAFIDSLNNPPDAVVNLRMRHTVCQGDVVCTTSGKIA